jgi:hypothetical protein
MFVLLVKMYQKQYVSSAVILEVHTNLLKSLVNGFTLSVLPGYRKSTLWTLKAKRF